VDKQYLKEVGEVLEKLSKGQATCPVWTVAQTLKKGEVPEKEEMRKAISGLTQYPLNVREHLLKKLR